MIVFRSIRLVSLRPIQSMRVLGWIPIALLLVSACSSRDSDGARTEQATLPAEAQAGDAITGEPVSIPSDAAAKYFILERGGTPAMPTLLTRRVGPSGSSYSKRVFDCAARTVKYLGNGDTLTELAASTPDPDMGPLVEGSIADVLLQKACSMQ